MISHTIRAVRTGLLALTLLLPGALSSAHAGERVDPREQTARAFFATGKYQDAIQIYAQMFAERPHPNHLFNIGRCYQNMGDPDHAIPSFREYLRKAKIDAAGRKEVEGYIKEMEALRDKHSAAERTMAELGPKESAQPAKVAAPVAPVAVASPSVDAGAASRSDEKIAAAPVADATTVAALAPASAAPVDPAGKQLAAWRSQGEALWHDQAHAVDEAKLTKIEGLLAKAPAADPRLPEYQLYLANLYAAKHFQSRLQANALRKKMDAKEPVSADEVKALEADANQTFLKAIEIYLKVVKAKSFPRQDEALYQLALVLEANNMESRAHALLDRLVRTMPDSKLSQRVKDAPTAAAKP